MFLGADIINNTCTNIESCGIIYSWGLIGTGMNSIEELRDARIATEIQRIEGLSRENLVRELVEIRAAFIESLDDREILLYGKTRKKD